MSNEKKISLYLRGDNLINLLKESKNQDRSANSIINIALENYLQIGSLKDFIKANPKITADKITEYLNSL